jgi:hypothetical protein
MMEGLAACFVGLADPRATRRCDHRLIDILVIAVCAVIACAESWEDIELHGRSKLAWLKTFLALRNGVCFLRRKILGAREGWPLARAASAAV